MSSNKRLYLIQVFRGLAAVLVVLAHCDLIFNQNFNRDFLFKIFNFGGSGVDFFFVLSGFIIFYVHQSDIGNKSKLKSFFSKRFIRIYPIYWVVLTLKILAAFLFSYSPDTNQRNIGEIVKAYLLFPQDRTILSSSFLGVSWTLSYEIFFYLMFALLIGLPRKLSFTIIATWLFATLGHFIGVIQVPKESLLLQFIFNERNLEFAFGCLAAYLIFKYDKIKRGMAIISLGSFFYTLSAINSYYHVIEVSYIIAYGIPSMLLVIGSVYLEMSRTIKIPNLAIYLGNASYSIYLMHGFALNNLTKFVLKIVPTITQNILILNIFGLISGVLAIACGCAVYSYMEKPLLSTLKPK